MPEKADGTNYVDLGAKFAVPLAILVATLAFNKAESDRRTQETCIDLQMKLATIGCAGVDCRVPNERAAALLALDQVIDDRCSRAGLERMGALKNLFALAANGVTDVKLAAGLARASGEAPPVTQKDSKAGNLSLAPQAQADTSKTPTLVPRVYVQIAEESQRTQAKALIERLDRSTVGGQALIALGPEYVANSHVTHTEVRCTKHADCAGASDLASYLGGLLGTPVQVRDLSAAYEKSPAVRPGHYELWFAPGPITLAPPPGNSS